MTIKVYWKILRKIKNAEQETIGYEIEFWRKDDKKDALKETIRGEMTIDRVRQRIEDITGLKRFELESRI